MNKHIKTSGSRNLVPDVLLKVCSENSVFGLFISPQDYFSAAFCFYSVQSIKFHQS